jgi:HlyD family secretion protein
MKTILTPGGALRLFAALLVLGVLFGGTVILLTHHATASSEEQEGAEGGQVAISVKTVRPSYDKAFSMTESRPADVVAYYRDDLESRVPGVISWIQVDIGDVVKKGDMLIKIDVPELSARVREETANRALARAQVNVKTAALTFAEAEKKVLESKVQALQAKLNSDMAYLKFREKQKDRYWQLLQARSIDAKLVDEQEDQYTAAYEKVNVTTQEKKAAEVQYKDEADARIEQATADLDEAKRKVEVVQANLEHAQALLDFATIKAPFDGKIIFRDRTRTNEGSVVQKAETGNPKPLLTIQRTDIVTVVMQVPDNFAPYVSADTDAVFETASLPGVKFRGKITRVSDSLDNPRRDRTMTVEVDLWNDAKEEFAKKVNDPSFLKGLRGLRSSQPSARNPALPIMPEITGTASGRQLRLVPGMFGQLTLLLRTFEHVYLLPRKALVIQGGGTYIYLVQDGKAHLQPVKKQIDDGRLVKVELLDDDGRIIGDLTGKEEVVVSNQSELSEGQLIKPTLLKDWKAMLDQKKTE